MNKINSLVIRQKDESQNGDNKAKHAEFSEKRTFRTCAYQGDGGGGGGKKCLFFGKFGVVCFLVISVLRFALLPYYRRIVIRRQFKIDVESTIF